MLEYFNVVVSGKEDFYELLGIDKGSDEKTIKSAYKKAARKYHPDNRETGNEELFKKIAEAYEVLSDPQKKTIYDQYGAEGLKGAGGAGGFGAGGFGGGAGFEDLGDIFSSFFGGGFSGRGGSSAQRPSRGQDQSVEIHLNFLDPIKELKKKIRINPLVTCSTCDGSGAKSVSDISTCTTCNGAGQYTAVQNTVLGQIRQTTTCHSCNGTGKMIKNPCGSCRGRGVKREEKEVEVKIPAGVYNGAAMRLSGIGDAGKNGGPPGDIYLHIHVKDDPRFEREGPNVYSKLEIGFADAALGIKIKVPTINGEKQIEIAPGTQSGETAVLKNEGFPKLNNPARFGDQTVAIQVKTPKKLNSEEKKLLEEFQKLRQNKDLKV